MTTYAEILAFVKGIGRINDTSQDTNLGYLINEAHRKYCRRLQTLGHPALRTTATITLAADTQDYNLAADFDRLIDNSVRYYTSGSEDYVILPIVVDPDAEIYEAMEETYAPMACRVIAGSSGTQRKLRLLPAFSETGKVVTYAYWRKPVTLSGSDVLPVPELSDAIAYDVLGSTVDISRDANAANQQVNWLARARASYNEVLGTLMQ